MEKIDNKDVEPWLRQRIAANVRRKRLAKGLSQEQLSVNCGMHRTYISQIERAANNLTIDNLQRIAEALGIDPQELLSNPVPDKGEPEPHTLQARQKRGR
ncbi:helix-turn-helix domain-containing protein [Paraburkholderia sp. 35.1]|uniref:helix-turn-helix domain-containing protein n=1 Tax=Paraburkholderia sp. 35.1 TaxID=2991058 RepID=UPI003D228A48